MGDELIYRPKLYLAGPSVFRRDAYEFGRALEAICADYGFEGIYPIGKPSDLVMDKSDPHGNAKRIFKFDMLKLSEADAVIADMSPFRGPGMDGGTAFEMGAAYMAGKPIVGYGPSTTYREKTEFWIKSVDPLWEPDPDALTGLVYDHEDMAIDDFGGVDNLMMAQSVDDYAPAFEAALVKMREVFDARHALKLKQTAWIIGQDRSPPAASMVRTCHAYEILSEAGALVQTGLRMLLTEEADVQPVGKSALAPPG